MGSRWMRIDSGVRAVVPFADGRDLRDWLDGESPCETWGWIGMIGRFVQRPFDEAHEGDELKIHM